ncbi:MAG: ArsC family reductase [Alphaproteobacteria bacterium]|nr:ArsC family reductase [Alphaproteobacteria bacterium]
MAVVEIYGIKNCDTMRKSLKWLEGNDIAHHFHDYKKEGVDQEILQTAMDQCGWENVINRRGTTWRKLPKEQQDNMDTQGAMKAALDNPSFIKRPLLIRSGKVHLGFKEELYSEIFGV